MADRRFCKRSLVECLDGDDGGEKAYRFQILLPNGTSTRVILRDPGDEMFVEDFVYNIRKEVEKKAKGKRSEGSGRTISWNGDVYLEDMSGNKIRKRICFSQFGSNKYHILRLHDEAGNSVNTFQNMWDLTPDTELLSELPAEYTFETALADLIDNSLQAVWSNGLGERRLVSVKIDKSEILIFDTGPGMDGSDENSIVKWGKMGLSNHRPSRQFAVGGKPPYLMPFFGMFGYGGPIASMHLGRRAVVSSKTKESKKVYTLHLEREALLKKSNSECIWRTDGGIRDPSEVELEISPHGSFTQVAIYDPKIRCLEIFKLQCMLKDIYFPYIQYDEIDDARKTLMPIEFQVNGINLAEIEGGEVAVTNLLSSNGPEFILQLCFLINTVVATSRSPGSMPSRKANARLRCVYLPIVEGKESIDRILEKLEADGCSSSQNFENFSRVSIRRLGRLLPDARWRKLPFMETKQRIGDKAKLLRRCCLRVKCFVETDAGFSPTPYKTDLAHHDPFTIALQNFGKQPHGKEPETIVKIFKDGKILSFAQLDKEYQDWILQMHDKYDEEIGCGEDESVLVVGPQNKKKLGISSDVVRVHRMIRRKGFSWKSGQKVKILKGAIGSLKTNLYATLEYILIEGFQGDAGGEARLICRPLGIPDTSGCLLVVNGGNASLDIYNSLSFPISVIDSGKCVLIDNITWNNQLEKRQQKCPSSIEILSKEQCNQLEIDGELSLGPTIFAGCVPPKKIVAVIRPASFTNSKSPQMLDQNYIVKDDLDMSMEVRRMFEGKADQNGEFIHAERIKPSSCNGFHGLYIFPLGGKYPRLFHKAGVYLFSFSVICKDSSCKRQEIRVTVQPACEGLKWRFFRDERGLLTDKSSLRVRVGRCVSHLSVACYDIYTNQVPFSNLPGADMRIKANGCTLIHIDKMKMDLSSDKMCLDIKDMLIESNKLDMFRPHYEAVLEISSKDGSFSATIPCQVLPGFLHSVKMQECSILDKRVLPGDVIEELILEVFDAYGNHTEKGTEVCFELDGLRFVDNIGPTRKVDDQGSVNLCGSLKVVASYGERVCLAVYFGQKMFLVKEFHVDKRELRAVSGVPAYCVAGSQLENIVFQLFDSEGVVDEGIHGQNHALTITSDTIKRDDTVQYNFQNGRCIVPVVPIPQEPGTFCFLASLTQYPLICTCVKVNVIQTPKFESGNETELDLDISYHPLSDERALLVQDSFQSASTCVDLLLDSITGDAKKLDEEFAAVCLQVSNHESQLKLLNEQKATIEEEIADLQGSREARSLSQINCLMYAKKNIVKKIEGKQGTAAAVFCHLSKTNHIQEPEGHFVHDIVGLVALLGTVGNSNLSRMFAEYLGENYMLAVVCMSYEAATALEQYSEDGKVNHSCALHEAATACGITINRRFLVICLDELRPYRGELMNRDPQRKLALPDPLLPSGKTPPGFLGYAVNMINLDTNHLRTRTAAGYGLRETLFYQLFGELQVYRARTDIKQAKACIRRGAVSLDGAIMKENGIISLGDCEPEVRFPVAISEAQQKLYQNAIRLHMQIEVKEAELVVICDRISTETSAHIKAVRKYRKKSERLQKFLADKGHLLDYKPSQASFSGFISK